MSSHYRHVRPNLLADGSPTVDSMRRDRHVSGSCRYCCRAVTNDRPRPPLSCRAEDLDHGVNARSLRGPQGGRRLPIGPEARRAGTRCAPGDKHVAAEGHGSHLPACSGGCSTPTAPAWPEVSAGDSESPTLRTARGGGFAGRAVAPSCDRVRGALRSRGVSDLARWRRRRCARPSPRRRWARGTGALGWSGYLAPGSRCDRLVSGACGVAVQLARRLRFSAERVPGSAV